MKALTVGVGILIAEMAWLSAGCGDPLKRAELLEELRPLGARVTLDEEGLRASPRPGETATVHWLVRGPEGVSPLGWSLSACEAVAVQNGLPRCAGPSFAEQHTSELEMGEPSFSFKVPEPDGLQGAQRLLVQGTFWSEGIPPFPVNLYIPVARELLTNQNPSFATTQVEFDGAPWTGTEGEGCDTPNVLHVGSGSSHKILIVPSDENREPLVRDGDLAPARETLELSSVSTAGQLDREQSYIESNAQDTATNLSWIAPKVEEQAIAVNLYFVLRDLRGGTDWSSRTLCVEP